MLATLPLSNWIILGLAILFSLGPGYLVYVLIKKNATWSNKPGVLALITILSITIWAILLSCFQALNIDATKILVIMLLAGCWVVGVWLDHPWINWKPLKIQAHSIVLWVVILSIVYFYISLNRSMVAGLGSDSYHHTLIIQMILDNSGLPDNYYPYAPIATFTYHYAFHAFTALIADLTDIAPILIPGLTGVTPRLMVLISGPFIMGLAALAVAFMTNRISRSPWAGVMAAALTGLATVFPGFMLTWGRYSQLLGLCILAVFIGVFIDWTKDGCMRKTSILLGLLASGVFLTHYRVAIMAAAAGIACCTAFWIAKRKDTAILKQSLRGLLTAGGIAILASLPWLLHLLASRFTGQGVERAAASPSYFDLQRLGPEVLTFPTNAIFLVCAALAIIWAILHRRVEAIWLAAWSGLLVLLALPRLGTEILDTITVVISLFLPVIVLVSWALFDMLEALNFKAIFRLILILLLISPLCLVGMLAIKPSFSTDRVYLGPQDLEAFDWIRNNIPANATFMVNTYNFDFLPTYIIGSDGGYWLPLLTGRLSVVPPMNYSTERWDDPDYLARLVALHSLGGNLTDPKAIRVLCRSQVTHVYIGEHGGIIDPGELDSSGYFTLLHRVGQAGTYLFKDTLCASE